MAMEVKGYYISINFPTRYVFFVNGKFDKNVTVYDRSQFLGPYSEKEVDEKWRETLHILGQKAQDGCFEYRGARLEASPPVFMVMHPEKSVCVDASTWNVTHFHHSIQDLFVCTCWSGTPPRVAFHKITL
jgi:hypothetical protein